MQRFVQPGVVLRSYSILHNVPTVTFLPRYNISLTTLCKYSSNSNLNQNIPTSNGNQDEYLNKKLNLIDRFKKAYSIYGKVVLVVHGTSSCLWFGSLYLLALKNINLIEILESLNAPNWMCSPFRLGGGSFNHIATTLLLYKIAAPFRYGTTILVTRGLVKYLRIKGKAPEVKEEDKLSNLAKESAKLSRERLRSRVAKGKKRVMNFGNKNLK